MYFLPLFPESMSASNVDTQATSPISITALIPSAPCARESEMKKVKAFLQGMWEFRLSFTTHYDDYALVTAYDQGRELAHKLTLRKFDNGE